jgi:LysR family transcriptional regulator, benzoate and cis,cis-muconate-responsive activator of ben and cat genes
VCRRVPELRHLRYFVAVAEELNFSRAARRLRMAQPPLSVAIRQLEQELGAQLFVRSSREVTLTEAGRALLDGARRTLAEAELAMSEARRAAAGELGSLRLGFSWSARFETLPTLGQALRTEQPDLALLTEEMWNASMPSALRSGSLDLAVSLCPEIAGELSYEPLRREAVVALLGAHHALAGGRPIPLRALADEGFVLFPRELAPRLYDTLVGLCRQAGFEPNVRSESFHSGWELGVLAELPVVAIVPESVGRNLPDGVAAVALSEPPDLLETDLVWRADDSSATLAAFLEVARGVFEPPSPTSGASGPALTGA